jgi:hypothetical protein
MPQESKLNGKTQAVLDSSPATDQAEVLIAENIVTSNSNL